MATFTVTNANDNDNPGSLRYAIKQANAQAGADIITFDPNFFALPRSIVLSSQLIVNDSLTIKGTGVSNLTISGDANNSGINDNRDVRLFFINQGTVNFNNLTLANGRGKGGDGGGGGAGMGGALFINGGTVSVNNVTFSNNQAVGGKGNLGNNGGGGFGGSGGSGSLAGGGGGSFGGDGISTFFNLGAGGGGFMSGGGSLGDGGGTNKGGSGTGTIFGGAPAGNGTSGFTNGTNQQNGTSGGGVGGGGGGGGYGGIAGNGGNGGVGGGGGGGGISGRNFGGFGGTGGDFGGGGGGGLGIAGGVGGSGGFGGGGGGSGRAFGEVSASPFNFGGSGGNGGFGGGGGGGGSSQSGSGGIPGSGGIFGGNGGKGGQNSDGYDYSGAGGGGAGLGGAIFIRNGSLNLVNSRFLNNTATGGLGGIVDVSSNGKSGANGQGKGGAIFAVIPELASAAGVAAAPTVTAINTLPTFSGNSAGNAAGSATDNSDVFGSISVTIPTNQPPVAENDSAIVLANTQTAVNINVLANDIDPDGNPLTISLITKPTQGTAAVNNNGTPKNPNDDFITYTPGAKKINGDSFTYGVSDGKANSNIATVSLLSDVGVTFVVTNTNDSGNGSLRQAILNANAHPGADTIAFQITTFLQIPRFPFPISIPISFNNPQTINLTSTLPTITDSVTIDGWSQGGPGFQGAPRIELNGAASN